MATIAPLDQAQAFVDKRDIITHEWYSWLMALCARMATTGSATFGGGTTQAVVFTAAGLPDQPDANYMVHTETPSNINLWVTGKTLTGFTLNSSAATSATVRWTLVRY